MTQFVFVHGVANRASDAYNMALESRNRNLRELVFGASVTIENPYWGEFGANPASGSYRSLPDYRNPLDDGVEKLGVDAEVVTTSKPPALVELARENFPETVDLLLQPLLATATDDDEVFRTAELVGLYAMADRTPAWIRAELSDTQFLAQLEAIAVQYAAQASLAGHDQIERLGLLGKLQDGAKALTDRIRNAGGRGALSIGRGAVHGALARFIGDVFCYLKEGAGREPIRALLKDPLAKALSSDDDVVLMGHSMGGVILVDCLGDPEFCESIGLMGDRKIAALVTVGSQPGLFQELGLLSTPKDGTLQRVAQWLNIYDEVDVLSFRAAPLFGGQPKDMMFSSRTGLLESHTAYFTRVQFYLRLKDRLKRTGVSVA